jgi:hypothetical protein
MATETCPYCGALIPIDEWPKHEAGRDAKRADCGHQDLDLIKAGTEPQPWDGETLPDAW